MELNIKPYLKAEDVIEGSVIEIKDEGSYQEREFKGEAKTVFEITANYNGVDYLYSMNPKTQVLWVKAFGKDTVKWIGKKGRSSIVQQNIYGQIKKVLYLVPIKE